MKLVLLSIETSKEPWFQELASLYKKKISRFIPFEIEHLRLKGLARDAQQQKKKEEAKLILAQINSTDFVIVCDEKGRQLDSISFSKKMISSIESGKKRLVFVIGGAFGIDESVAKRADWTWSFSNMTMNHFVAQSVALEQIYRALTIWKGVPYHNE